MSPILWSPDDRVGITPAGLAVREQATRVKANRRRIACPDCGAPGERRGHMECQYPRDEASS